MAKKHPTNEQINRVETDFSNSHEMQEIFGLLSAEYHMRGNGPKTYPSTTKEGVDKKEMENACLAVLEITDKMPQTILTWMLYEIVAFCDSGFYWEVTQETDDIPEPSIRQVFSPYVRALCSEEDEKKYGKETCEEFQERIDEISELANILKVAQENLVAMYKKITEETK